MAKPFMKKIILLSFLLFLATVSFGQKNESIRSIKQLTDSIQSIIKREHITGLMLGITTKDSVLFSGGFGYADLDTKRNVNDSTLFRMGSITKMFVSLGIMKLVNEGKLKLEDELKKIAPEVPFQNKWEITNPVRIINLLEHTTGFDDIKLNRMYSQDSNENKGIEMMLVHKNSMICRWKPGERFAYSNPNYAILGYIIEKISGKPYDQYLYDYVLNPLGMSNSNFNLKSKFPQKDVKEYIVQDGKTIRVKSVTLLSGPQGALWSSSSDMIKFLQLLLRNGAPLFAANTIAEIETPHSSLAAQLGQKNGYSLANDNTFFSNAKYPFRGHDGITGTCFSACKYNRELNIGYVIASNCNHDNYAIEELIVSFLEQNMPSKILLTQTIDKKLVAPFLGRYQFESPRNVISAFSDKLQNAPKIYFENEKLYFKPLVGAPLELVQTSAMTFAFKGRNMPLICFTKKDNGKNVMMIAGSYYEQASNFWAVFKRVIIIIALLFSLSSIILGLVSSIAALIGKLDWQEAIPRIAPTVGLAFLAWSVSYLLEIQQYTYKLSELDTVNFHTIIIFFGTSVFAVISIVSLFYSIKAFGKKDKRWFTSYLLLTSISLCLITAILFQSGLVGLRTWAL
jgi:CubicO group peptidase (beta-lactamase class C family)